MTSFLNRRMLQGAGRRPVTSARRGVSLIEVAVSLAIAGVLMFALVRFLVGVLAMSGASVDTAAAYRDVTYAAQRFSADAASALGCDPAGLDTAVTYVAANEVRMWADPDGDGAVTLVSWRSSGGKIQRSESVPTDGCTVDIDARSWTTVAEPGPVTPVTEENWVFATVTAGVTSAATLDCAAGDLCRFDALRARFTLVAADRYPVTVERAVALNPAEQ